MPLKATPFFSVIIPTFNRAQLLMKAVDSVIKQQYANWELIVVDDGSTDNTATLITGIDDDRVRYIYQTNSERSAARNNGINHANGNYICFLDSDDYYLPERLIMLYKELEQRRFPCQMFYTGLLADTGGLIERLEINEEKAANIFDRIVTSVIHSQQVCICHTILREYKFDTRFRIAEDTELWLRIAQQWPVNYLKNQLTVAVLQHEGRTVNLMRNNSGKEQLIVFKYILQPAHSGNHISAAAKKYMLADSYHAIARYQVNQNNRWAAANYILKALASDVRSPWSKFRLNVFFKLLVFTPMQKVKTLIDA